MDIKELYVGARVVLEDGSIAEVLTPPGKDGSVRVRYIDAPFAASLVGTEADCTDYEIQAFVQGNEFDSRAQPGRP